ncbi:MAG: hypothetical protein CMF70_04070 [Magnetovibrio sp.]|nr:hypothetical protein [Magnetovibrio sp.]
MYYVLYILAFLPLPLALVLEILFLVEPDIIFGLLTISILSFGCIFLNTDGWKTKRWITLVLGVFFMGGIAVYLTMRIVFEHS